MWEQQQKHKHIKVQKADGYLKVTLSDGDWLHLFVYGYICWSDGGGIKN
jgi:hypothetical protein